MKIVLDAGHGPNTLGKRTPDGRLKEFQFNVRVAEEAKKLLVTDGHTILFTHEKDNDVPLAERVKLANRLRADLFVSIHANAYGTSFNSANGIETYTYTNPLPASKKLASFVHQSLLLATGRKDRGVKKANFFILRETVMPAILIECGFMTNREEAALLESERYRLSCARAVAFGINCYNERTKTTQ